MILPCALNYACGSTRLSGGSVRRLENRKVRRSTGFLLLLLSVGCNESPTEPNESVLPFSEVVYRNPSGFKTPLRTVLRSEAEWQSFWSMLNENESGSGRSEERRVGKECRARW